MIETEERGPSCVLQSFKMEEPQLGSDSTQRFPFLA